MGMPDRAWRLLQLSDLAHQIQTHDDRLLTILHRITDTARPTFALALKRTAIEEVHRAVDNIEQLAERAASLTESLPVEAVEISYEDLATAASRELAEGNILDAERVRLAARVLDHRTGWRSLAHGLRATDAHTAWETTTISDLLGSFRHVPPKLVREIATAAGIAPGAEIAACEPDEIARLAAQLDTHTRA